MAKKAKKKAKDNNAHLHFMEDGLYNRVSKNAAKNKRTIPSEIVIFLEENYK